MSHMTTILRTAAIVGLLASTASMASAQTTKASATAAKAPTTGVRAATTLRKKSALAGEAVVPAILGAAIIGAGIYIAVDDDNDDDDSDG